MFFDAEDGLKLADFLLLGKSLAVCFALWTFYRLVAFLRRHLSNSSRKIHGSVRALVEPDQFALPAFLKGRLSLSFRLRLAWVGWRYAKAYGDPIIFVKVINDSFLSSVHCRLDDSRPFFRTTKWRNRALELLDAEFPNAGHNLDVLAILGGGLLRSDLDLLYWINHREILERVALERHYLQELFDRKCGPFDPDEEGGPAPQMAVMESRKRD